ncbi:MAG: SufD family Fe-S cluster assembly protein [Pseudomonadota bacterium]
MTESVIEGQSATQALSEDEITLLRRVGFGSDADRSGTAVLANQTVRFVDAQCPGLEILSLKDALNRYDWVQDLMFKLISPDANDKVLQAAESTDDPVGHFVYVHDGARIPHPVQTFTMLETPQGRQFTHNITVIGEDAEVEMISGAAVPQRVHAGHHVSIEETYLRKGARCRSVSIESWGHGMEVESYSRTEIGDGADQTSNQIMLAPIKHHVSDTQTFVGANASSNDQAIIFAPKGANRLFDTTTYLTAPGARSESIARMVSAGGTITNQAVLVGDASDTTGFLGCDGLKLTDDGAIVAIPSLTANSAGAQLSHEASVGMVAQEKLSYLMASGLSEDSARDLIVHGFLNLKEQYLPAELRDHVTGMIAAAKSGGM